MPTKLSLKNSQITITGGTGFLGTNLRNALISYGVPKENILCSGRNPNLRDRESSLPLFENTDIVFHLAANVGGIGKHKQEPATIVYDNLMMNTNVIDLSADKGVKKLVLVGTACSYPESAKVPLKEEDIWNGYPAKDTAPYGWAKRMMMVQAQAYREQYGLNSITLIPTNIYGKYDHFDSENAHVIPALISRITKAKESNAKEVAIWGDGTATREFIYAEDVARAFILGAERYNKPESVNIGTGIETPIKDLVYMLCELIGYKGRIKWDATKPSGSQRRQMDVARAEKEFGFRASIGLKEGLKETIEWYQTQKR
jgi:GDP-L-fucose synthase